MQHTTTNTSLPIAANVVIGTNIFSDIGASYVDFFGGRSTSYEKKMQETYKRVTETLKQRAQAIRADAIIGLSVDIDKTSGKGNQLFMPNIMIMNLVKQLENNVELFRKRIG